MTIDRANRDRLANAIRDFSERRIGASTFDDEIIKVESKSNDDTVQEIVFLLWFHYDDFLDHPAILSREEWDFFQRLLLVLESDAHLIEHRTRIRSASRWIATLSSVGAAVWAWRVGLNEGLYLVAMACAPIAILLWLWQNQIKSTPTDREMRLTPFSSTCEMLCVRRSVPGFRKMRYPGPVMKARLRSRWLEWLMWVPGLLMMWVLAPLFLLVQALPQFDTRYSVSLDGCRDMPEGGARG